MGFDDHPVEYFEEDGVNYVRLDLGGDKANVLKSLTFCLVLCDEDGNPALFLGEDADTADDWEEGVFTDNFRGVWGSIDGHPVMMEVTSMTDGYILYEVLLKINGKLHNLTVAYDYEGKSYKMLTAKLDESETGGVPAKDERLLVAGDEITTVFLTLDDEDPAVIESETFKFGRESSFEEMNLPDGLYAFAFMMTDYKEEIYYSVFSGVTIEDGEIEIFDPDA